MREGLGMSGKQLRQLRSAHKKDSQSINTIRTTENDNHMSS